MRLSIFVVLAQHFFPFTLTHLKYMCKIIIEWERIDEFYLLDMTEAKSPRNASADSDCIVIRS